MQDEGCGLCISRHFALRHGGDTISRELRKRPSAMCYTPGRVGETHAPELILISGPSRRVYRDLCDGGGSFRHRLIDAA